MSYNPDSIKPGEQFSAHHGGTKTSSHHPASGWGSQPGELKHQPGRNTVPDNTVEILDKGTHLPPDRTFLPQNAERTVPVSTRDDGVGTGLDNDQIQDTLTGSTSKDVYQGMGMPGDVSQQETRALGEGGRKKGGAGLAQYGEGEQLAMDKQKQYDSATDYTGNSREEKEYRNIGESGGSTRRTRGPGSGTY